MMEEETYERKYFILRVLKGIQEYLKSPNGGETALYPIRFPNDFLIQILKQEGTAFADDLVHEIFQVGLKVWAERLYMEEFGSPLALESFIDEVKERQRAGVAWAPTHSNR